MSRIEKAYLLHRLLRDSRYTVPLERITAQLECSESTFHRLRSWMRDRLGAPIEYNRRYGGYFYDTSRGEFELPGVWFSPAEAGALACIAHALNTLQHGFFDDLTGPLRERLHEFLRAEGVPFPAFASRLKLLSMSGRVADSTIFRCTAEAVFRGRRLAIDYLPLRAEKPTRRRVSPQRLVHYRDCWYVDCWCHLRDDLRCFAVNRIAAARMLRAKARKIPARRLDQWFAQSYGIFSGPITRTASIRFTGIAAKEVAQETWHPHQKGSWETESTYLLEIPYGDPTELIMDILRWGDRAQVINPPQLRQRMKTIVNTMHQTYRKAAPAPGTKK